MGTNKVIKINTELEVERLKDELSLMKEMINYSLVETVKGLEKKVRNLEDEAIALRAADFEKDKLIKDKDNTITYLQNNINILADVRASKKIKDVEYNYKRQLVNAKSNGSKTVRVKNEELNKSLSEQKKMNEILDKRLSKQEEMNKDLLEQLKQSHNNEEEILDKRLSKQEEMNKDLLEQLKQSHNNEKEILAICNGTNANTVEMLTLIKKLLLDGTNRNEIAKHIDKDIESAQKLDIEGECKKIHNLINSGKKKCEIAEMLYPNLARGKSKVSERIRSKTYLELFGEHIQFDDMGRQ